MNSWRRILRGANRLRCGREVDVTRLSKVRKPFSARFPSPQLQREVESVAIHFAFAVFGLQDAVCDADLDFVRSALCAVPGLQADGSERVDGKDVHASVFHGAEGYSWRQEMAMRVLPVEFFQFPAAQGSLHVQAVEESRGGDGGGPSGRAVE